MRKSASLKEKIVRRIRTRGEGAVFVSRDFLNLGSRAAVDQALSRLARGGEIRRVGRGVYDYPRKSESLGINLNPATSDIARAIAASEGSRLQIAGGHAANALGLSTQVPSRIVYLTDGTPRTIQIGRQSLVFRRASPRTMATSGRTSGTVIQALRHLGKKHVNQEVVRQLRESLSDNDKATLRKDKVYAPAWIQSIVDQIVAFAE